MTEPHMLRIDSRDLADLIDERERLADSLAECTREAMNSADEWRAEVNRANAVNTDYQQRLRTIQELLGYDQPALLSEADLAADIRALVDYRLSAPTRLDFWQPSTQALSNVPGAQLANAAPDTSHSATITGPSQPVDVAAAVSQVLEDSNDGTSLRAHVLQQLDEFPGWSHDQAGPPATPRAPQPRTWKAGDPEPPVAGPGAVWGVTAEISGDLYRHEVSEEHGWVWVCREGDRWEWYALLSMRGPLVEAFPPSPEPRADLESTPAGEALNEPVTSDNTANTDIPAEMEGSW